MLNSRSGLKNLGLIGVVAKLRKGNSSSSIVEECREDVFTILVPRVARVTSYTVL